jgi:methylmalonyl-CoA mutase C-terminal domain/subunit
MVAQRLRVVVAKPGTDDDDHVAAVVARALRDAGHEVIYTGLHQSAEQIVETAIQEDADLIGVTAAHDTDLYERLLAQLSARDAADIVIFGSGVPHEDVAALESLGVARAFAEDAVAADVALWVAEQYAE